VAQKIDPTTNWFFDAIDANAGNGAIERQAFDVASYGRQLGLITEVLLELSSRASLPDDKETSLGRLKDIKAQIDAIKLEQAAADVRALEASLRALRDSDPEAFADMIQRVSPLLALSQGR
jgi:hypothetical protein